MARLIYALAAGGGAAIPIDITFLAAAYTWTNAPAAETEWPTLPRTKFDLTDATSGRVTVRLHAGTVVATQKISIQYSTDQTTWYLLAEVTTGALGTHIGAWTDVPAGAKADIYIRVVGSGGDGAKDPQFSLIKLQVK